MSAGTIASAQSAAGELIERWLPVARGARLWIAARSRGARWDRPEDRFLSTLFVAAAVHAAVILGVTFTGPESPDAQTRSLDVVLVHSRSDETPEEAQFLADASQDGGGDEKPVSRPASPLPAPLTSEQAEVVSATPPTAVPTIRMENERRSVLTQEQPAAEEIRPRPPKPRPRPEALVDNASSTPDPPPVADPNPKPDAVALVTKSLAYASLNAEVDRRLESYAARPRRKWVTARTRESKYAAYMDAWRAKIERIGNLNYPDAARRRRLSGSLLLDVSLNGNGSVNDIVLRRSSGHRVLDDAAIRIVKLAAPFAPLPADIRKETDILHIERTWRFLASNRLSSR